MLLIPSYLRRKRWEFRQQAIALAEVLGTTGAPASSGSAQATSHSISRAGRKYHQVSADSLLRQAAKP